MTDNTELKQLAESLIELNRGNLMDWAATVEDARIGKTHTEYALAANPAAVLALIADNEKLFKLLERTVEQYVPLTELEGMPGWSRAVELVEVVAERDQLRAEVAGLRTGYEAYERVNAELKAENEALRMDADRFRRMRSMTLAQIDDTQDEFDAEFDRQLDAAMGKGEKS